MLVKNALPFRNTSGSFPVPTTDLDVGLWSLSLTLLVIELKSMWLSVFICGTFTHSPIPILNLVSLKSLLEAFLQAHIPSALSITEHVSNVVS